MKSVWVLGRVRVCVGGGDFFGFECDIVDELDWSALHTLLSFGQSLVGRLQNQ